MGSRSLTKTVRGSDAVDGAGVRLVRVLGHGTVTDFDPFLMLDAFDSRDPKDYVKGFPWHPHRGIETVTYLIEGRIEHGDSLGNSGTIGNGDCQWMTAGSGIIHQEMPKEAERMLGLQLWLNLPAKDKMTGPKYRDITAAMVPKVEEDGTAVAVISGHFKGVEGAIQGDYVKTLMLDADIKPGGSLKVKVPQTDTLFFYVVRGSGTMEGGEISAKSANLTSEGEVLDLNAGSEGLRAILFSGAPLKEPVAWGGPIVMNTREELDKAFSELRDGSFIRHR
ncbi:pirin family protein [Youngiibacter fragilis]|uniref:Pirin n=1 Tax=Youngiibacter fragilis 232.1 TaxID=994573 RepID=V7I3H7_9CLOT|nr:pirin family protein [Youngiibacter fragilis]ETA79547.1 pirin [Youngiibacter fragilis 232.1]